MEELYEKEKEYIRKYDAVYSYNYYNIDYGGKHKSKVYLNNAQRRKYNYMKKQIDNDAFKVRYFLYVDDNGNIEKRQNPNMRIAEAVTYNGKTNIHFLTVFDNSREGKPPICRENDSTIEKDPVKWFEEIGYVEIEKSVYANLYSKVMRAYYYFIVDAKKYYEKPANLSIEISNAQRMKEVAKEATKETAINKQFSLPIVNKNNNPGTFLKEYIKQNAATSQDFDRLLKLTDEFGKDFNMNEIFYAVTGHASIQKQYLDDFNCSKYKYDKACEALDYMSNFKDITNNIKGRKTFFNMAINFCFNCDSINNDELIKRLHKNYVNLPRITSATNMSDAIQQIDSYYNHLKGAKNKVDIKGKFELKK